MKRRSIFKTILTAIGAWWAPPAAKPIVGAPPKNLRPSLHEIIAKAESELILGTAQHIDVQPDDDHELHMKIHDRALERLGFIDWDSPGVPREAYALACHREEHFMLTMFHASK